MFRESGFRVASIVYAACGRGLLFMNVGLRVEYVGFLVGIRYACGVR